MHTGAVGAIAGKLESALKELDSDGNLTWAGQGQINEIARTLYDKHFSAKFSLNLILETLQEIVQNQFRNGKDENLREKIERLVEMYKNFDVETTVVFPMVGIKPSWLRSIARPARILYLSRVTPLGVPAEEDTTETAPWTTSLASAA